MSIYVIYPEGSDQANQISNIFKAAATRSGEEKTTRIIREIGVIDTSSPRTDSFNRHLSDMTHDRRDEVWLLDINFTEEETEQLKAAGATVSKETPEGYQCYQTFNR